MLSITDDGRTCTKCGEFKPWGEFYRHPNGVNGKNPRCKACCSAGTRARAHVLKQRAEIELPVVKRCARCGEIKASDVSNVQPLCRSCNARKAQQTIDYRPA